MPIQKLGSDIPQRAIIIEIVSLMELGFVAGEEVRVLRRAPLGGPLQVQVRDTCYAIRRSDAKHISIMK